MYKLIVFLLLSCCIAPSSQADVLRLQDNPPARYTVVKGDTLWDIAGKFLKNPWQWPEIWGMNKAEIKNPHWIYPGDVVILDTSGATPRLSLLHNSNLPTVVLSPEVRESAIEATGIPPIPTANINPFLKQPFVMEKDALEHAPRIIDFETEHLVVGAGNLAYATNDDSNATNWKILHPKNVLLDPVTQEVLGYQVRYLGSAKTVTKGNPQTISIVSSSHEIEVNDRLIPAHETYSFRFVPHAPDHAINGFIISTYRGITEVGQYDTVIINKGARDGLDAGSVLAVYKNKALSDATPLPAFRVGLIMLYRVFDKVSYAIIMQTTGPVNLNDYVRNP
ncbi:MAG TPA: LysM peptidoglycan-binding domain-containing protein [Burkholderiales bacterium]|nr:LysM peptidoglycan-binding domain-containing protein [Burkholderiales bacterium]